MAEPRDVEVSVVIPCRDVSAYLPDAIASAHEQDVAALEVVVVDDGSTAPLEAVARGAHRGVRVLRHDTPRGPAAARNTGLDAARGRFIAFLDADDVWEPGALAGHVARLDAEPTALFITGATEIVCMPAAPTAGVRAGRVLRAAKVELLLPATVFRREAFEVVGRLDEALTFGEDADWFLRAREQGVPYLTSADRYLLYRRHDRNMTCGRDLRQLFVPQTIIRSLRRRRRMENEGAIAPVRAPEPKSD